MDSKQCFNNKNVFATNRAVYMVGGTGENEKTEKFEIL